MRAPPYDTRFQWHLGSFSFAAYDGPPESSMRLMCPSRQVQVHSRASLAAAQEVSDGTAQTESDGPCHTWKQSQAPSDAMTFAGAS